MGRPRADGIRVHGPYKRGNRWYVYVVQPLDSRGRRPTVYRKFATRPQAEAFLAGAGPQAKGRTVRDAVESWIEYKRVKGRPANTIRTYREMLGVILGRCMDKPIRYVLDRGDELYTAAQVGTNGKPRAADTHRNALGRVRELGRWLVKHRWLPRNPFADVEAVGQRRVGADKSRLTTDESRVLDAWCATNASNKYAVLTMAYLELGMRASELCARNVRDLDDDGTVIRVGKTKTAGGRRGLQLPPNLSAAMRAMVVGRPPDAPIFTDERDRRLSRFMARLRVHECCKAAGVTVVPPQALRRTNATLASEVSETPLAIARHLGHTTGAAPAVTTRSYVARGAEDQRRVRRALGVIQGGKR